MLSLQPQSSGARAREPRSRADRHFVARCPVRHCRARACVPVEMHLPAAWEASPRYTLLTIVVAACREHARELDRRAAAMLDARADLHNLLAILEHAAIADAQARERLETAEAEVERLRLAVREARP